MAVSRRTLVFCRSVPVPSCDSLTLYTMQNCDSLMLYTMQNSDSLTSYTMQNCDSLTLCAMQKLWFTDVVHNANLWFTDVVYNANLWFADVVYNAKLWFADVVCNAKLWFTDVVYNAKLLFTGVVYNAKLRNLKVGGDRACLLEPVFQLKVLAFMEISVLSVRLPLTMNETCGNVDHASAVYPNTKSTGAETVKFATTSLRCRSRWQRGVFVLMGTFTQIYWHAPVQIWQLGQIILC